MAFDAVAVRCLVKDLKDKLINSRIDKIHQPEKDEITINLRTMTDNFKLVLSASPAHPAISPRFPVFFKAVTVLFKSLSDEQL